MQSSVRTKKKRPKVWSEIRGKKVANTVAVYWRKREKLMEEMGGKCVGCGRMNLLEFDHIFGITWVAASVSSHQRLIRYRKEWEDGLLQLLCGPCNKIKGRKAAAAVNEHSTDEGEPF